METVELCPQDEEVSVDVTFDKLAEQIGNQHILQGDEKTAAFAYLAALALECEGDGRYDIEDVLSEFLHNSSALDISLEEADKIDAILRGHNR